MLCKLILIISIYSSIVSALLISEGSVVNKRSAEELLKQISKRSDTKINLLETVSLVEELVTKSNPRKEIEQEINSFVNKRLERLNNKSPRKIIEEIADYLYREEGFTLSPELVKPDITYISKVLKSKKGNCLSMSIIWLLLAERLNLPIYPIIAPEHIFLRWISKNARINIETTRFKSKDKTYEPGQNIPDSVYIEAFSISKKALKEKVYMTVLTKKEIISAYLNNLGAIKLNEALDNDFEGYCRIVKEAKKLFDLALEFSPTSFTVLTNLATLHLLWLRDVKQTEFYLGKIRQKFTDDKLLIVKAILQQRKREFKKAEILLKSAWKLAKSTHKIKIERELLKTYLLSKNLKEADVIFRKIGKSADEEVITYYIYREYLEGHYDNVVLEGNNLLVKHPSREAYALLSLVYLKARKSVDKAIEYLEKLNKTNLRLDDLVQYILLELEEEIEKKDYENHKRMRDLKKMVKEIMKKFVEPIKV